MKAYTESHPKRDRSAYKAAYDAAHAEEIAAYVLRNKERNDAYQAAYYVANRDRILSRVKAHTEANYGRIMEYHARYAVENREKVNAWGASTKCRRRARLAGGGGSHTIAERQEKFAKLGNICFYCGTGGKLTIDHDVPIARGGSDNIGNILPACGSCNRRKSKKTAMEFLAMIR